MDFRTKLDNQVFGVRSTALIVKDDKLLLTRDSQGTYYTIGGAIEVGEWSSSAVCREVMEELGVEVFVDRLAFVVENRFCQDGVNFHNIEFHYIIKPLQEVPLEMIENHVKQVCEWIPIKDLPKFHVKPDFLKTAFLKWDCQLQHVMIND